ncbi:UPF0488 protein C8orf33-like [Holothuria leucospilota]|uniref:UPF0488 protein C8orf33-like n=1 Tax=Holothuria leucospilota TaxID=206669 RepID=A0A9Q1H9W0_HOLLE|nr:UPF0488 protein C8orf33-like [Holothuria leucospilota]
MKLHSDNISDMNPILRAAANGLNRSRSEGQIRMEKQREVQKQKRRQEKEKRRVDALEREKKWMALEKASGRKDDGSTHEESAAEKFQKELCWCIQQLEMGLANMKPNPRQAQEVEKVLRTLKSPKAPIAKKRQVMRTTFGDYRSKMLEEEKKHAAVMANKTNMSAVSQSKLNQATFYRKSLSGSLFHQRSFSSPAGYTPSLSPTKEEAISVGNEPAVGEKEGLAPEKSDGSTSSHEDMSPSIDSNKILEAQMGTAADDSEKEIISEKCDSDKSKELRQSSPCKGEVKNISHKADEGFVAASEKDSPTHSVISSVSSDSFNPATSSSSSSSHESLLAPNHPASCFRFDFKIEEEEGEDGRAAVEESLHENQMNKENKITGSGDGGTTPSSQDGVSPTIEGLSKETTEAKKKKRNRRKKKKKEQEKLKEKSENVEEKNQECADEDNKETDDKNSTDSQIKLSLGGGDFKFDFETKVESS